MDSTHWFRILLIANVVVVASLGCAPAEPGAALEEDSVGRIKLPFDDGECGFIIQKQDNAYLKSDGGNDPVSADRFVAGDIHPDWIWCLDLVSSVSYRITPYDQPNKYLDAYEGCCDSQVVVRSYQNNDTQRWNIFPETGHPGYVRIQQHSSQRYLDAYTGGPGENDVVTRTIQTNDTQRWELVVLD